MKRLVEKYFEKDKKLSAAFMDLETAYNWVDRESIWSMLQIYGVGGQLLKGIQAFYTEANARVRVGKRVMRGRSVVDSLAGVMIRRNVSMNVKRGLRKSILLPILTYGSENWTWNGAQQSRFCVV